MNSIVKVLFLVAIIGSPTLSTPINSKIQNQFLAADMNLEPADITKPKTWAPMPEQESEKLNTQATKYVADQLAGNVNEEFNPPPSSSPSGFVVHFMVEIDIPALTRHLFSVKMNGTDIVLENVTILGIPQFSAANSNKLWSEKSHTLDPVDIVMANNAGLLYFKKICADPKVKKILFENLGYNPKIAYSLDVIQATYAGVGGSFLHFVFQCTK